jgi:hypothetical protein
MNNSSYNIISFISNNLGNEKITYIYDTLNKRVIEKWKSYQLKSDLSKYIITDRFIYTYNHYGIINKIVEIQKGNDSYTFGYLSFTDDNEYSDCITRKMSNKLNYETLETEITYTKTLNIGLSRRKKFLRTLIIEQNNSIRKKNTEIRLKSLLLWGGRYFTYQYSKDDFNKLISISEYQILIDLRIFNKLFRFLEIQFLKSLPNFFIMKRIKKDHVNTNFNNHEVNMHKQDYFTPNSENFVLIHDTLFKEDLFLLEQLNLMSEYNNALVFEK